MAKLLSNTRVYGTATVDTRLFVNGTTAVHSTNSGALQVGGGIGVAGGGFFAGTVTATNFVGSVSGASASLNGGTAGQIPYQVSPGVTSFFGPGAVGELLVGNGTSIPLFASTTTIYVGNAVTATNVRGGSANQFIYQTAPGVTAFINTGSMYVGNAVTATNVRGGNTGEFIYQSAPGVTAFINTSSMYVGRAAVADTVTGGGSTVQTAAQVGNAAYYLTFVDSNNAVATAELVYTTSSFVVNASTGNVGLGTTSPSEKLELSGAADAARIKLTNSALGRSSILGHGSNGFYWQPTNNGDLFELRDSAATGHVAFNPNTTNFGIGTTGPTTKLHVAGAAAETKVRVSANDGTNYRGFEVFAGSTQKGGMYYRTTEGNVLQIWGPNTGIGAIYIDSNNVVDINSNSSVHSTATGALQVIGGLGVGGGGFFGGTVTATNFVGAFTGAAGQVETRQATANSSHFLTFVDSNNVSATAEIVYTTSSVTVNPGTGFVGMGTSSPSQRLTVSGQTLSDSFALSNGWSLTDAGGGSGYAAVSNWVRMNGTGIYTTGNTFTDLDSNTSAYEVRGVNNDIIARYENTGAANSSRQISFLPNGGNFGLGTQSPYSRFTIVTDAATNGMSMFTSAYIATQTWGTRFWKNDIGGGIPLQIDTQSASTWYTSVRISHGQSSGHPSLRSYYETHLASDGGNVGIGTTSPNNKLHIFTGTPTGSTTPLTDTALLIDSAANQYLEFRTTSGSGGLMQGLVFTDNGQNAFIGYKEYTGGVANTYGESIHLAVYDYSGTDSNNGIYFGTSNTPQNGVSTAHMFIKGNGDVGIGTTSPTNQFSSRLVHIRTTTAGQAAVLQISPGSGDTNSMIQLTGDDGSNGSGVLQMRFRNQYKDAIISVSGNPGSATTPSLTINTGNAFPAMTMAYGGNIGIANSSPQFKLDVTGTARATADFRAPIFYDTDNTSFYADPASTSIFNILQVTGYVRQQTDGGTFLASDASENNNWLFQENARGWGIFYLNRGSQSGQTFGTYTTVGAETFFIGQNAGTTMPSAWTGYNASSKVAAMISNYSGDIWAAGRIYSANSLMAPTFIDSDDQNFFVNPAGSSTVNNVTISGNKTFARFNSAYVFARGTGLNNNANRYVAIDGTERVNDTTRGLTLTIINAATLAFVSSTNYDTYGDATASTNLGTAITNMTSAQIGILTSYDAWELNVNDNLRNAARKVGLSKLAHYTAGGSRRPYAAIFYGSSDDTNASTKDVIERMESDDADAPRALITTYITSDGAFSAIDGAYSLNALYSSDATIEDPVLVVNSSGNVGIGTNTPQNRLHVSTGSSGATADSGTYCQLVVEDSSDAGIHIINPTANIGRIMFGTPARQFGGLIRWDHTNNNFDFGTDKSGGYIRFLTDLFQESMRITSTGNVGIGLNTNPVAKLNVVQGAPSGIGALPSGATAVFDSSTNNYLLFRNSADNNTYSGIAMQDNNVGGFVVFGNAGGAGDLMYVAGYNGGQLLWGTSDSISPTARSVALAWNSTGVQITNQLNVGGNTGIGSQVRIVSSEVYGLTLNHAVANAGQPGGYESLFVLNTNSNDNNFAGLGMSTNGGDGQHHRGIIRSYRDTAATGTSGRLELVVRQNGVYSRGFYIDGNAIAFADNRMRAPIFEDSNDTTFYADLASSGSSIRINGSIVAPGGMYGAASGFAARNRVWSISPDYTGWGIFYNEGANDNISFEDGTVRSRIYLNGNRIDTGILYDIDNTAYYFDGTSTAADAVRIAGGLHVSVANGTGVGIILADDGDIVDLNDGYCSMRFSFGVRIFSANRGGSAQITLAQTGNITATGTITSTSDQRLKTNLDPITNSISKIQQLTGYTFDRIDKEGKHTGLIAQEVEKVLPEVVLEDSEGMKSVAYGNMAGLFVEAIKELKKELDESKELILSLKKEIAELKKDN